MTAANSCSRVPAFTGSQSIPSTAWKSADKRHNRGVLTAKSREVGLPECGFLSNFQLLMGCVLNRSVILPQRDFGLAGSGPSTSLKIRANSAREMTASHHGLSTNGNKIIRSHAHQGGRAHLLTPCSLDSALSSMHRIKFPSPLKLAYRYVAVSSSVHVPRIIIGSTEGAWSVKPVISFARCNERLGCESNAIF